MTRKLLFLSLLFPALAIADEWPAKPFSFLGVPTRILPGTFHLVDGPSQGMEIKIIKVIKGRYDEPTIAYDFHAGSPPPLRIGAIYLFSAIYDRHGIRYTADPKITDSSNNSPEPTGKPAAH